MHSLRILVFSAAALSIPVASFAQNTVAPGTDVPVQSVGTVQQQTPQQADINYAKPQASASASSSTSNYGAPMNGSYAAGHRQSGLYGPTVFEHH